MYTATYPMNRVSLSHIYSFSSSSSSLSHAHSHARGKWKFGLPECHINNLIDDLCNLPFEQGHQLDC